ncbi:hypothetical protein EJB05_45039, partial [Eragrostis curvula]
MGVGNKRPREGGELSQVAEMVMVLAAAMEVRGGLEPTVAERALMAEARCKLTAAVEKVARPRELFPREAVRAVVQDLGLGRASNPAAMGYRPRRASIADKLLLTKRMMEEVKEASVHSTTNVSKTMASSVLTGPPQIASRSNGSPRSLSTSMTSPVITKHLLPNGTIAGASYVKPANTPPIVSLLPVGSADIKVGKGVNGSHVSQSGGAATIDRAKNSYHLTATCLNQTSIQNSSQAHKYRDKNISAIRSGKGSIFMEHQTPSGEFCVHEKSVLSHQKEIANEVKCILYQSSDHPSWAVPSTEYMSTRLDCQICKVPIADMESLLVCDSCEKGMHLNCLPSANQRLTRTWHCPPCLVRSNGKLLPSKYGKVKRTFIAPKTSMTSGAAQPFSQVAAESPTKKDCNKKAAANESATNQNSNKGGSTVNKSSTLALDTASLKPLSISGAGPQKENVKLDGTSFIEKERAAHPGGGIHTETAISCNEGQGSGASRYGSSNLSGGSHMHIDSSSVNLVEDSILQANAQSGFKHSNNSSVVSSKENCEGNGTYQHLIKNVQMSSSTMPTNEIHQADGVVKDGIRNPHKEEIMAKDAISDHGNVHQVNSNGHIFPDHEIMGDRKDGYVGCCTSSIVGWVGDALKAVNNKTYYNSCNIDGIIYNLHDHILIAIEGSKPVPCKLQSLWQDHDSGSRLAMVNPYFFRSDIPELISKPCTDEENEVYGPSDEITVLLTAIGGPCEVLHVDTVREEAKRRCQLDSSGSRLHPMFFCRWNYDESTKSLYKDYDSVN